MYVYDAYMTWIRHNLEKDSTWCTLLLKGITFKAKVAHIGRGKFCILDDDIGGRYINTIIDASDVFQCNR
jgi:hypothetical protein